MYTQVHNIMFHLLYFLYPFFLILKDPKWKMFFPHFSSLCNDDYETLTITHKVN